ncbi:hypothetical protein GUJ93_ZPchr0012g19286 [Zizania palustris]|uniref:Uncharacterized protein n=1 Tax=Zizania palustris TaxID=103762 RepID=A0A8J6BQK6_ZIZPA|nr:hypothetical protein GUJ93_ZPchr0012g19286 [Zizania palustris]
MFPLSMSSSSSAMATTHRATYTGAAARIVTVPASWSCGHRRRNNEQCASWWTRTTCWRCRAGADGEHGGRVR